MSKRKTMRAADLDAAKRHSGNYSFQQSFLAGVRHNKRESKKVLSNLLLAKLGEMIRTENADAAYHCDGITASAAALGIKLEQTP